MSNDEVNAQKVASQSEEPDRPKPQYITIKSGDGHEFRLLKDCAVLSGAMRAMLASEFVESEGVIEFKEISKPVMEKVVQYVCASTVASRCYLR